MYSKEQLIDRLKEVQQRSVDRTDPRWKHYIEPDAHLAADMALLKYINDPEVTEAFMKVHRWYA